MEQYSGSVTGTVDADPATVSNLEVDNFKASAIVIEGEGIASNDNDTTLPNKCPSKRLCGHRNRKCCFRSQ